MCRSLGIRQGFTKPYSPQKNGKAERFIQTALNEWAYAAEYRSSDQRRQRLPEWLKEYNWLRPHGSLNGLLDAASGIRIVSGDTERPGTGCP